MTDSILQLTTFHTEKIRTAVNVGRRSAYQIVTIPGRRLGRIGKVAHHTFPQPANESRFPGRAARNERRRTSWIRRVLAALRS